jgi:uncharacterized repeat protein (TIGR04042 family)
MPEVRFIIRWPDGSEMSCYSPSRVVREYLEVGRSYPVADFLARSRAALSLASERVRAKYGYACTGAMEQLAAIEERAAAVDPGAAVAVVGFELPPEA